jgi:transposase
MPEPIRRLEVFTGAGRRRVWSSEEKAAIIAETCVEGETVCSVARRYGLAPSQLFAWRRLARRASVTGSAAMFVPAVVEAAAAALPAVKGPSRGAQRKTKLSGIELEVGGVEVRVGADASPRAIAAVIRALRAAS